MKKTVRSIVLLAALSLAALARAEESSAAQGECQLRVATGMKGKIFSRLLRDIRSVCSSQLRLCEVESESGLQNAVALSANAADLGFVQLDTLQDMKQSDENVASLQAVMPVSANLLHILTLRAGFSVPGERSLLTFFRRDDKTLVVTRVSELKGLPVALVGSARLLGRTLDRSYGLGLRFVYVDSDEQAIAALKTGQVAAVFLMSGWPNGLVEGLTRDAQIALAAFDLPVRAPYVLVHKNYPRLDAFMWPFLAVPNMLVTRPFNPDGTRGRHVLALQRCIASHLEALREGAYEPGWKEIKNPGDMHGWPGFANVARP